VGNQSGQSQAPLVQVRDWSTGSAGEADPAAPSSDSEMGTSSGETSSLNPFDDTASVNAASTEIALKPAIGTLSLGASMAHAVTLEIAGIKQTLTGARVKLVLKNNSQKGVNIPEQQKIAFQIEDKPEQLLDILFDIHHVPAGGSAYGTVKLPAHQLDPDADLYLPKFLEDGKKKTDLHATAEITDLQATAKPATM
jgi:hypothetical protein